jgi:hypothetical protein
VDRLAEADTAVISASSQGQMDRGPLLQSPTATPTSTLVGLPVFANTATGGVGRGGAGGGGGGGGGGDSSGDDSMGNATPGAELQRPVSVRDIRGSVSSGGGSSSGGGGETVVGSQTASEGLVPATMLTPRLPEDDREIEWDYSGSPSPTKQLTHAAASSGSDGSATTQAIARPFASDGGGAVTVSHTDIDTASGPTDTVSSPNVSAAFNGAVGVDGDIHGGNVGEKGTPQLQTEAFVPTCNDKDCHKPMTIGTTDFDWRCRQCNSGSWVGNQLRWICNSCNNATATQCLNEDLCFGCFPKGDVHTTKPETSWSITTSVSMGSSTSTGTGAGAGDDSAGVPLSLAATGPVQRVAKDHAADGGVFPQRTASYVDAVIDTQFNTAEDSASAVSSATSYSTPPFDTLITAIPDTATPQLAADVVVPFAGDGEKLPARNELDTMSTTPNSVQLAYRASTQTADEEFGLPTSERRRSSQDLLPVDFPEGEGSLRKRKSNATSSNHSRAGPLETRGVPSGKERSSFDIFPIAEDWSGSDIVYLVAALCFFGAAGIWVWYETRIDSCRIARV